MTTKIQPSNLNQTLNYSINQLAANTVLSGGVDLKSYTDASFTQANTAISNAAGASLYANAAFIKANTAPDSCNTANYATTSIAVSGATQANITSVGTLTGLSVSGDATFSSWVTMGPTLETLQTKSGATGTVTHDVATGTSFYHTSPAADFTANFTNVPTTNDRILVTALVIVQGATAYLPTAVQIGGAAQTINWTSSTAPTGTANKTDIVSFSFLRTGSTWTVYGQASNYG
jgi:hypothetical protein